MKIIHVILAVAVVAAGTALAVYLAGCNQRVTRAVTINILSQIPRAWLILETAEELTLANIDGGGMLLGPRCGMAAAIRRSHWGCDLASIRPEDIAVSGRDVRIKLPEPSVFDTMVDMGSFRYLTRRSGFQALADVVFGRSLMRELAEIACRTPPKYSREQIQARRSEFILRLNDQAKALFAAKDLDVRFE